MPLMDYSTKVEPAKSAAQIHDLLVKAGASAVMGTYKEGRPTGFSFRVDTPYGPRQFNLPVNPSPVEAVLRKQKVDRRYQGAAQAERVAWRIMKDWVEAQLAIIQTEMVTIDEVMLPYMQTGADGETVYELYRDQQLALTRGGSDA